MPHVFTDRPRLVAVVAEERDFRAQDIWQAVNAAAYKPGGLVFIGGSVHFLPRRVRGVFSYLRALAFVEHQRTVSQTEKGRGEH